MTQLQGEAEGIWEKLHCPAVTSCLPVEPGSCVSCFQDKLSHSEVTVQGVESQDTTVHLNSILTGDAFLITALLGPTQAGGLRPNPEL